VRHNRTGENHSQKPRKKHTASASEMRAALVIGALLYSSVDKNQFNAGGPPRRASAPPVYGRPAAPHAFI
jgi:hypothetical protein